MPPQGSEIKVARAKEHLDALDKCLQKFVDDHPVTLSIEPNPRPPHYVAIAHGYVAPDPSFGALIGDFAHNARSALDLLIQSLSKLSPGDPARFRLEFPICDLEVGGDNSYRSRESRELSGVGTNERATIEGFQPYQLGSNFRDDLLGILGEVNNADKHRLIHVVGSVGQAEVKFYGPANLGAIVLEGEMSDVTLVNTTIRGFPDFGIEWINRGVITKDMAMVASITSQQAVKMEPKVTPQMQFGEGSERAQGRPLGDTLVAILDRVEEVLGKF